MEFLSEIWGWVAGGLGIGIAGIALLFVKRMGLSIACKLIDKYLPDETIREWGRPLAVGATTFMAEKLGKGNWNKLEDKLQHKLGVFLKSANTGLDSDDK